MTNLVIGRDSFSTARIKTLAMFMLMLGLAACTQQPGTANSGLTSGNAGDSGNTDVLNVADAAIASNDPAMALTVSQSVLGTDHNNLDALYHEGAAYYAVGRCMDAIAAYKVALTVNPASSEAETGIGRCMLIRNAATAETDFAAAVTDDPGNAVALNDLGIARDLQGKYAAAIDPYQKALTVAPGTLPTEVNLGLSLALSGDSEDALGYLGPLAAGSDATPKIREDYAMALVAAGRTDDARQVLGIDLPPGQVSPMLADFAEVIAAAQTSAAQAAAEPAAPAPTDTTSPVAPIMATPLPQTAAVSPIAPASQPVLASADPIPSPAITAPTPISPQTAPPVPIPTATPPQVTASNDPILR